VLAALHKEDREAEIKEKYKILRRQEMERLLYVALTRARHTLILVSDRELFCSRSDRVSDDAQLKFLRGDYNESSFKTLDALPTVAETCERTIAAWQGQEAAATPALALEPLDETVVIRAREHAVRFIRKQNPSGYDEPADLPLEAAPERISRTTLRSLADNPATLYGAWWHSLLQHFPWKDDPEQWEAVFDAAQQDSPDANRSAREWQLLQESLRVSPLTDFVRRPRAIMHTEFPFLWPINDASCLEGVIDFAAIDLNAGKCLLLDWKTNRITSAKTPSLRTRYLPQISAYWKAVHEITSLQVEAGLYSTATGKLLMFDGAELETEWKRLAKLPAEQMRAAVTPAEL
jgi:ATP-dependent exoDNAse (exonuclease V) beta subunit